MSTRAMVSMVFIACLSGWGVAILAPPWEGLIGGMAACAAYLIGVSETTTQE